MTEKSRDQLWAEYMQAIAAQDEDRRQAFESEIVDAGHAIAKGRMSVEEANRRKGLVQDLSERMDGFTHIRAFCPYGRDGEAVCTYAQLPPAPHEMDLTEHCVWVCKDEGLPLTMDPRGA